MSILIAASIDLEVYTLLFAEDDDYEINGGCNVCTFSDCQNYQALKHTQVTNFDLYLGSKLFWEYNDLRSVNLRCQSDSRELVRNKDDGDYVLRQQFDGVLQLDVSYNLHHRA